MSKKILPKYNTLSLSGVWEDSDAFIKDIKASPFPLDETITDEYLTLIFYLIFGRFGDAPIINGNVNFWKYKVFSLVWQYSPEWIKKLDIQKSLRNLTLDELLKGSDAIYNHAYNPSTEPGTHTTDELDYINEQNVTKYRKAKVDAYLMQWQVLNSSITQNYLNRFAKLFKIFVSPDNDAVFVSDAESDSDIITEEEN